jgi:hypothetical protein
MQIRMYFFAKINLAQIFPLCLFYGLMLCILRVQLSNVHTPSLPSRCTVLFTALRCTILFTALTCEVVNNKYFSLSWNWRFVFIFYGLCLGYELEVIRHFTMTLCCTVTVCRILKTMTMTTCLLPWDHYVTVEVESFAAVYSFHYLCPVLSVGPDNIRHILIICYWSAIQIIKNKRIAVLPHQVTVLLISLPPHLQFINRKYEETNTSVMDNGHTELNGRTETFKIEVYILQCSKVHDILQLWSIKGSMKNG